MTADGIALRDALRAETGGNPFFVREILRHLAETGAIYQHDGRWVMRTDLRAAGLPVSVREVIGRRVAMLGAESERLLSLAAVIGRDFDLRLLTIVARSDEDAVIDHCDAAVAAAILRPTDDPFRYTFAHALIEHTLYDSLSPARRARAHYAVAEAIEARLSGDPGERAGELAHHWAAAVQPAETGKAVHYAGLAGQRALDQLAPDEALRWFTQAIELVHGNPAFDAREHARLLIGLGCAQRQCGVAAYRETLLDAAHVADAIDAGDLLVRAALENNRGWFSALGETDSERIAVIDRAIERLDGADSPDRARLLTLACSERFYDSNLEKRLSLANEAIATARRSGDPAALADALSRCHLAVVVPWTLERRTEWAEEACGLADTLDDPALRIVAHTYAMTSALERADLTQFRRHASLLDTDVGRVPQSPQAWSVAMDRVIDAVLRGDLAEAERLADAAFTLGSETGQPDAFGIYGAQIVGIRNHQGRAEELIPLIEHVIAEAPGLPIYHAVLAYAVARSGYTDRARELLDVQVADGLQMRSDASWAEAHSLWADAAVSARHEAAAELIGERIAPYAGQIVTAQIAVRPAFAYSLGRLEHLLGRYDAAQKWFGEAMAIHERLESPLLVAYTQAAWSALLADQDPADHRARLFAEQALATATAGGYGYIARDATVTLERLA
jgi:hypothetical protein